MRFSEFFKKLILGIDTLDASNDFAFISEEIEKESIATLKTLRFICENQDNSNNEIKDIIQLAFLYHFLKERWLRIKDTEKNYSAKTKANSLCIKLANMLVEVERELGFCTKNSEVMSRVEVVFPTINDFYSDLLKKLKEIYPHYPEGGELIGYLDQLSDEDLLVYLESRLTLERVRNLLESYMEKECEKNKDLFAMDSSFDCFLKFLSKRSQKIAGTFCSYSESPHSPVNQFCYFLAKKIVFDSLSNMPKKDTYYQDDQGIFDPYEWVMSIWMNAKIKSIKNLSEEEKQKNKGMLISNLVFDLNQDKSLSKKILGLDNWDEFLLRRQKEIPSQDEELVDEVVYIQQPFVLEKTKVEKVWEEYFSKKKEEDIIRILFPRGTQIEKTQEVISCEKLIVDDQFFNKIRLLCCCELFLKHNEKSSGGINEGNKEKDPQIFKTDATLFSQPISMQEKREILVRKAVKAVWRYVVNHENLSGFNAALSDPSSELFKYKRILIGQINIDDPLFLGLMRLVRLAISKTCLNAKEDRKDEDLNKIKIK